MQFDLWSIPLFKVLSLCVCVWELKNELKKAPAVVKTTRRCWLKYVCCKTFLLLSHVVGLEAVNKPRAKRKGGMQEGYEFYFQRVHRQGALIYFNNNPEERRKRLYLLMKQWWDNGVFIGRQPSNPHQPIQWAPGHRGGGHLGESYTHQVKVDQSVWTRGGVATATLHDFVKFRWFSNELVTSICALWTFDKADPTACSLFSLTLWRTGFLMSEATFKLWENGFLLHLDDAPAHAHTVLSKDVRDPEMHHSTRPTLPSHLI